tara:strand:- start:217 stop:1152 length:936 start_codon:yes stop_codon:yes gene_type:complete
MKISCLVPTRGRPTKMVRLANSIFTNADTPSSVEIVFYIDNDDLPSKECADKLKEKYNIKYLFEKRIFQSQTYNEICKLATGDIFFIGADDIVVATNHWDTILIDAFDKIEDKIALFYGYDMRCPPRTMPTHPIVHRKWFEVVGHVFPSNFDKGGSDHWVNYIAKKLNRKFFLNICTPHLCHGVLKKWLRYYLERHNKSSRDLKRGNVICEDKVENDNIYKLFRAVPAILDDTYTIRPLAKDHPGAMDIFRSAEGRALKRLDLEKLNTYITQFKHNNPGCDPVVAPVGLTINEFADKINVHDFVDDPDEYI